MSDVTQILSQIERGDPSAASKLLPLVYDELRKLARARMADERAGHTLQPTALVHEAYLRLVANNGEGGPRCDNRGHFFFAAAEAMRRILIESARRKGSVKHGGQLARVELNDADLATTLPDDRLLAIDDALNRLADEDPQAAELVKLHFFAGFSITEAAEILGLSRSTAYAQWAYARAWLQCRVAAED
jgi:RNA polymerase sigma factor (TIGR02999 family)